MAGTTRPTANRALQTLVSDGTVQLGRSRIVIADVTRLGPHASVVIVTCRHLCGAA